MLSLFFVILAGICNSIMDTVQFRYHSIRFKKLNERWWDPKISWHNKWKNGDPEQGEKYFGSSTFLILFTDAWHFVQSLMILCFSLAIVLYSPMTIVWIDAIIYYIVFGLIFELFWSYIWRTK